MPLFVLPIGIRSVGNLNMVVNHPAIAVVMIAVSSIGLPFFMVAASATLLQKWLSQTNHLDASDPYFLYAASNAGSLIGLALYPCLLEPAFWTGQQAVIWSVGYAVFLALTIASGLAACRWHTPAAVQAASSHEAAPGEMAHSNSRHDHARTTTSRGFTPNDDTRRLLSARQSSP